MGVSTRIDPIGLDLKVSLAGLVSPEAQSAHLAAVARREIGEAATHNARRLGRAPARKEYVDGRQGARLENVRPNGVIVAEFELFGEVVEWIDALLILNSPVLTGRYAKSHVLFADGVEVDPQRPPVADEYVFLNVQPYARKIERGQSRKAPDGVYQAVAAMAGRRFGNLARVSFSYRSPLLAYVPGGANRQERAALKRQRARVSAMAMERESRAPAIVVQPR